MSVILEGSLDGEMDEELDSCQKERQERPPEEIYAVVFMDAIHFHVGSES
ncbi:MAG: hypothetical protein PHG19_00055 [Anaerotignum sp.]|nr:hypothetical protein [Anaerotignum sp.]